MEQSINVEKLEENVSLYKKYKMFAYDLLFYYAISILFFTLEKGFSMSQVMYISSAYTFSSFILQLPANLLVDKLGLRKSIILGNLLNATAVAGCILLNSFLSFILLQILFSIGFALKNIAESSLIYSSMKNLGRKELFSKLEGSSNSKYYYLDAVTAILAGYMFLINGYLPMLWCFAGCIVALIISSDFNDVHNSDDEKISIKEFFSGFKKVTKSRRLNSILLFACVFTGIVAMSTNLYKAVLLDFKVTANQLAFIVCGITALAGIGARSVYYIEKKTKNKTLTVFSLVFIFMLLVIGLQGIQTFNNRYSLLIICICLVFIGIIQGAYRVAIKKYITNFTHSNLRTKIITLYYLGENVGSTLICFVSGLLLEKYSNGYTTVIMSLFGLCIIGLILVFMKKHLGLKPEEYSKKELYGEELEIVGKNKDEINM